MTEYWLQKKTIGGWSQVTWYADKQQALINLNKVAIPNNGYSWRVVEATAIDERLLEEVKELPKLIQEINKDIWDGVPVVENSPQDAPKSSGWGQATSWTEKPAIIDPIWNKPHSVSHTVDSSWPKTEHGLSGSVWVIHHGRKEKLRVPGDSLQKYIDDGFVRGGPRTQFE